MTSFVKHAAVLTLAGAAALAAATSGQARSYRQQSYDPDPTQAYGQVYDYAPAPFYSGPRYYYSGNAGDQNERDCALPGSSTAYVPCANR